MKWLVWTGSGWRPRAFLLITTILVVCIASNPELAAFVPVIDAFGLDVLMYLFAAQLGVVVGGLLWPLARYGFERARGVVIRLASCAFVCLAGGYLRQLSWHARLVGVSVMAPRLVLH
ncbi:MAG: hypothetical protein J7507_09690 [Pseudoxanthomonas sp.]|nr:hypothetical protein [Pseudoxanthomonas sp.]